MPRPRTIRDDDLVAAAREVFSERGTGATTAEIAQRAGVSEGTLFRRFGTKDALLARAIGLPSVPAFARLALELPGRRTVPENLTEIVVAALVFYRHVFPRLAVAVSSHIDPRAMWRGHEEPPPLRAMRAVAGYLEAEARLGRVAPCDALVVARILMGSALFQAVLERTGLGDQVSLDASVWVRGVVDVVTRGILPDGEPRSEASSAVPDAASFQALVDRLAAQVEAEGQPFRPAAAAPAPLAAKRPRPPSKHPRKRTPLP